MAAFIKQVSDNILMKAKSITIYVISFLFCDLSGQYRIFHGRLFVRLLGHKSDVCKHYTCLQPIK